MTAFHNMSIKALSQGLHNKTFSSVELTQFFLQRIQALDKTLNSFITVTADTALEQAKQADACIAKGEATALTGIPIAHKDIFCTEGIRTSCGSKMLDNFNAPYNATVVSRCAQHGLVMLGKTNMDEFAMGSTSESSFYGSVHNPWRQGIVPGGSSGGAAAVIAAGLSPLATGSDTGGSIRQPAAFCGITGLKPTYGRVSRYGMIAYASSLDQGGPMARSAEDCAYLLNAMAGHDARDSTSMEQPVEDYVAALNMPLKGLRIGLPKAYFNHAGLASDVVERCQAALAQLEHAGAILVDVDLQMVDAAIPAYYLIAPAEASSNLSRYDGVRFGYRCDAPADLKDLYMRSRSEGFGEEVKRRILIGTYALSAGYYDAYYVKAQKVRRLIQQDFVRAFEQCDVIAGPTTPTSAYALGAAQDPVSMYLGDIYTIAVNLAGLPALSMPVGLCQAGLPVGLQLIAPYWQEGRLLSVAHHYQTQTDFHQAHSPVMQQQA